MQQAAGPGPVDIERLRNAQRHQQQLKADLQQAESERRQAARLKSSVAATCSWKPTGEVRHSGKAPRTAVGSSSPGRAQTRDEADSMSSRFNLVLAERRETAATAVNAQSIGSSLAASARRPVLLGLPHGLISAKSPPHSAFFVTLAKDCERMAGAKDRAGQVQLDLRIELGRAHLEPGEIAKLASGSMVTLEQLAAIRWMFT